MRFATFFDNNLHERSTFIERRISATITRLETRPDTSQINTGHLRSIQELARLIHNFCMLFAHDHFVIYNSFIDSIAEQQQTDFRKYVTRATIDDIFMLRQKLQTAALERFSNIPTRIRSIADDDEHIFAMLYLLIDYKLLEYAQI